MKALALLIIAGALIAHVALPPGRYQLVRAADSAPMRIDTITGRVQMYLGTDRGWVELGK